MKESNKVLLDSKIVTDLRSRMGVSQQRLAASHSLSVSLLARVERGEKISRLKAYILANALKVTLEELLHRG